MFSHMSDASKVAYARLVEQLREWGYELIDCQARSAHLESLGAMPIPRGQFNMLLEALCGQSGHQGIWKKELL
jgi:leucyl/phenylalanyl-tRNA--protein transferase